MKRVASLLLLLVLFGCKGPAPRYEATREGFWVWDGERKIRAIHVGEPIRAGTAGEHLRKLKGGQYLVLQVPGERALSVLLGRVGDGFATCTRGPGGAEAAGPEVRALLARLFELPLAAFSGSLVEMYGQALEAARGAPTISDLVTLVDAGRPPLFRADVLDLIRSRSKTADSHDAARLVLWAFASRGDGEDAWRATLLSLASSLPMDGVTIPAFAIQGGGFCLAAIVDGRNLPSDLHDLVLSLARTRLDDAETVALARAVVKSGRFGPGGVDALLHAVKVAEEADSRRAISWSLLDRALSQADGSLFARLLAVLPPDDALDVLLRVFDRNTLPEGLLSAAQVFAFHGLSGELRVRAVRALLAHPGVRSVGLSAILRQIGQISDEPSIGELLREALRHPLCVDAVLLDARRVVDGMKEPDQAGRVLEAFLERSALEDLLFVLDRARGLPSDTLRAALFDRAMEHPAYGSGAKERLLLLALAIGDESKRAGALRRFLALPDVVEGDLVRVVEGTLALNDGGVVLELCGLVAHHRAYGPAVRHAFKTNLGRLPSTHRAGGLIQVLSLPDVGRADVRYVLEMGRELLTPWEFLSVLRTAGTLGAHSDEVKRALQRVILGGGLNSAQVVEAFETWFGLRPLGSLDLCWAVEAGLAKLGEDGKRLELFGQAVRHGKEEPTVRAKLMEGLSALKEDGTRREAILLLASLSHLDATELATLAVRTVEVIRDDTARLQLLEVLTRHPASGRPLLQALKDQVGLMRSGEMVRRLVELALTLEAAGSQDLAWAARALGQNLTVDSDRRRLFVRLATHAGHDDASFRALVQTLAYFSEAPARLATLREALQAADLSDARLAILLEVGLPEIANKKDQESLIQAVRAHPRAGKQVEAIMRQQ